MIHGWSVDHRLMSGCMEPAFASAEHSWQRIYFDLPGMGKTPGPDWIGGSDDILGVVLEFIDALLPGKHFLLAGESYGGYLARGVLKARREMVDGLLLICPVASQETLRDHLPELRVLEKDEKLLASLSEKDRGYLTGINVIQTARVWERFKVEVMPALKIADYDFLEHRLSRHVPYREDVDKVDLPYEQPALMVMGRQDNCVGYHDHWQLLENFARMSFMILDKAGHNLQIEQDELFTAAVKEWLRRVQMETAKK
jgi:pimeloyl-ACP methyl ester carboxylesterase